MGRFDPHMEFHRDPSHFRLLFATNMQRSRTQSEMDCNLMITNKMMGAIIVRLAHQQ